MKSWSAILLRISTALVIVATVADAAVAQAARPMAPGSGVIVNGAPVPRETIRDLERIYRTPIYAGRFNVTERKPLAQERYDE